MVVSIAYSRNQETYFIFRENGKEIEVFFNDEGKPQSKVEKLTKDERQWFLDGKHKLIEKNI